MPDTEPACLPALCEGETKCKRESEWDCGQWKTALGDSKQAIGTLHIRKCTYPCHSEQSQAALPRPARSSHPMPQHCLQASKHGYSIADVDGGREQDTSKQSWRVDALYPTARKLSLRLHSSRRMHVAPRSLSSVQPRGLFARSHPFKWK